MGPFLELNFLSSYTFDGKVSRAIHQTYNHYFLYCMQGKLSLQMNQKKYVLTQNELCLISPKSQVTFIKGNYEAILIQWNGCEVDFWKQNSLFENQVVVEVDEGKITTIIHHFLERDRNILFRQAALLELLSQFYVEKRKDLENIHINEAIKYIKNHYQEEITIGDIARFCSINQNYLSNLFMSIMNQSPKSYLTFIRMEKAKELLLSEQYQVEEVGKKVGYKNALHFSAAFKKFCGLSPLAFVKETKNLE